MIKEESYNKMSEGYMVTHKLFNPSEYLYMDDQFIIRNQDGTTFENDWNVLNSPEWNTDWYIYKGKFKKGKDIPDIIKKNKINLVNMPMTDRELLLNNTIDESKLPAGFIGEGISYGIPLPHKQNPIELDMDIIDFGEDLNIDLDSELIQGLEDISRTSEDIPEELLQYPIYKKNKISCINTKMIKYKYNFISYIIMCVISIIAMIMSKFYIIDIIKIIISITIGMILSIIFTHILKKLGGK